MKDFNFCVLDDEDFVFDFYSFHFWFVHLGLLPRAFIFVGFATENNQRCDGF